MRDLYGRVVPARLVPIFTAAAELREIRRELERLYGEIQCRIGEPYMRDIVAPQVLKHLHAAATLVGLGAPSLSRCRCHPQDLDCPICEGEKWVSETSILKASNGTRGSK